MPYNDEQWNYFSHWKNYSLEKDLLYSKDQVNYFLQRLKHNEYFSLVRYGEGESRIILNNQKLQRSELSYDPETERNSLYVTELEEAAKVVHPNYFVGIQSYTYKPKEPNRPQDEFITQRNALVALGNLARDRYTCSRIFCNFHLVWQIELQDFCKNRDVYLVCSEKANENNLDINFKRVWKVSPKDAWKNNSYNHIVQELYNKKDTVLITAAGFFGNILISKLSNYDNNFNLNVGSIYDQYFFGKATRPYMR
jgi:hypothetical protein